VILKVCREVHVKMEEGYLHVNAKEKMKFFTGSSESQHAAQDWAVAQWVKNRGGWE
jgi:hypothetical protein